MWIDVFPRLWVILRYCNISPIFDTEFSPGARISYQKQAPIGSQTSFQNIVSHCSKTALFLVKCSFTAVRVNFFFKILYFRDQLDTADFDFSEEIENDRKFLDFLFFRWKIDFGVFFRYFFQEASIFAPPPGPKFSYFLTAICLTKKP